MINKISEFFKDKLFFLLKKRYFSEYNDFLMSNFKSLYGTLVKIYILEESNKFIILSKEKSTNKIFIDKRIIIIIEKDTHIFYKEFEFFTFMKSSKIGSPILVKINNFNSYFIAPMIE